MDDLFRPAYAQARVGSELNIDSGKDTKMLVTIAVLLVILWLLGMISSYTLGGFIHILLVLAIIAVLVRVIQGRSPV
jgi:asparagine N-glycosylation enzyme membrane subunit Stt3